MTRPIHLTVARRWRLVRLGSLLGAGALVGSAVAWALGAPPWLHLAAIVLGAAILLGGAVGLAWPIRLDDRRALRWVGERVGLAYETAWDHARDGTPAAVGSGDRATALRAAVAVEGRLSVRDLRPPPAPAWWLPLATVALGLWAWAALSAGGTPLSTSGAAPRPPSGPSAPAPATPEAPLPDEVEDVAIAPPELETAAGDPGAGGTEATGAAGAPGSGGDGAATERDALERFLENLRERPPPTEEERRRAAEARAAEAAEDGVPATETLADPFAQQRQAAQDVAGEGDPAPGTDEEGDGEATEPADDGDEGPMSGDDADGVAGDEAGAPGEAPEAGGEADPSAGDAADGAGLDEAGEDGLAGIGIGAEGTADDPSGPAVADPETLPSMLGPGPEHAVGGVQLLGVPPEGEVFPVGPAGAGYRRAVEQALNEGEVPVPYQEVIRNYFR